MIAVAFFLMFIVMPIAIFTQKYYAIRSVMKKNNCSVLEAIKICDKQERTSMQLRYSSNSYDSRYKTSYSDYHNRYSSYNDDHRYSPSYSYLSQNIHHRF